MYIFIEYIWLIIPNCNYRFKTLELMVQIRTILNIVLIFYLHYSIHYYFLVYKRMRQIIIECRSKARIALSVFTASGFN